MAHKIIVVGHEKGGTGKTTLAVNLAAMGAKAGKDVLLVDTDKQTSASIWSATRHDLGIEPPITCIEKRGKVGYDIAAMRDKFDLVIVDAGGRDSIELRQSIAVCDLLIMPMRPSQFDTWSQDSMVAILRDLEERTGVHCNAMAVINAASANPSVRETDEIRAVLGDPDYARHFGVFKTALADRIAFRRAARDGRSVVELSGQEADPKASLEMQAFYKEIFDESYVVAAPKAA